MTLCKTTKTWARTGHRNLLKHQQSGNYYARTFAGGKEIWKSLKTSHRSVAKPGLQSLSKTIAKRISNGGENSAKMTFDQAAKIHLQNLEDNPRLKPRTRDYWRQRLVALTKGWDGLNDRAANKVGGHRITHHDLRHMFSTPLHRPWHFWFSLSFAEVESDRD